MGGKWKTWLKSLYLTSGRKWTWESGQHLCVLDEKPFRRHQQLPSAQQNWEDSMGNFKRRHVNCCCCNREQESEAGSVTCSESGSHLSKCPCGKNLIKVQTCTWVLSPTWEQSSLKWPPKSGVWDKKSGLISWDIIWLLDLVCKTALSCFFICVLWDLSLRQFGSYSGKTGFSMEFQHQCVILSEWDWEGSFLPLQGIGACLGVQTAEEVLTLHSQGNLRNKASCSLSL